jgi:hypothetical protein
MKHLTEEQKAKLIEALDNFVRVTVWGWDTEYAEGKEYDEALQRELIEPFIEPLINGEL